jgi:hypothetical protein
LVVRDIERQQPGRFGKILLADASYELVRQVEVGPKIVDSSRARGVPSDASWAARDMLRFRLGSDRPNRRSRHAGQATERKEFHEAGSSVQRLSPHR